MSLLIVDFDKYAKKPHLSTEAPNGRYLAISSVRCDCCGEPFTTYRPLVVRDGMVDDKALFDAARSLADNHPSHPYLKGVDWNRDGSFTLKFV